MIQFFKKSFPDSAIPVRNKNLPSLLQYATGAETASPESIAACLKRAEIVAEWRLRHAQAYDHRKFVDICKARKINPDNIGSPIENMPHGFRNWEAA